MLGVRVIILFYPLCPRRAGRFSRWHAAALAALILALVGAWAMRFISGDTLQLLFAIAVAVAGVRTLFTSGRSEPSEKISIKKRMIIGAIVGGFAGFMGGLLGLGGGFIIAPMLMEMGYPTKQAAATTAFIVTFSSFSGFLGHMAEGRIDPMLAVVTVILSNADILPSYLILR